MTPQSSIASPKNSFFISNQRPKPPLSALSFSTPIPYSCAAGVTQRLNLIKFQRSSCDPSPARYRCVINGVPITRDDWSAAVPPLGCSEPSSSRWHSLRELIVRTQLPDHLQRLIAIMARARSKKIKPVASSRKLSEKQTATRTLHHAAASRSPAQSVKSFAPDR